MEQEKELGEKEFPEISFDEFEPTSYDTWKEETILALKGADFDKSMFTKTYEGITLKPIYIMTDTEKLTHCKTYPGLESNLRGVHAGGYMSKPWTVAQESDSMTPADANAVEKRELLKGTTAVSFRLDKATLKGLDVQDAPDDEFAKQGASLSTLSDLETVLDGIELDKHEIALHAGASNVALLGNVAALAMKRGIGTKNLNGAVTMDPIGELVADGKLPRSLDEYYDEMAHGIAWAKENAQQLRTVMIEADTYHNGGANDVQEVAYAMSEAIAYIKAMQLRNIDINSFAQHVRFHFSVGANFFMEIAKLRAAKMIWAQVVEAFGGEQAAKKINLFVSTSSFTQTTYDPYVNLLRAASQSFSAVVGGIDGMTVKPFDSVIRPSDEFSRRIARNIQIMMQSEFNFLQPVDPAGGSWYIESLTDEFAEKVWAKMQEIEKEGGLVACLANGKVQAAVKTVLDDRFKKLATRADRAVGNNMYPNVTEVPVEVPVIDFATIKAQRLADLAVNAKKRDENQVQGLLKALDECDGSEAGVLVDLAKQAMIAGATMGEIAAALTTDATALTIEPILPHRWTEHYEEMRRRTEAFKVRTGENVKIFLANMGPIPQHKARAEFVTSFMQVANFEVMPNDGFPTVEEAVDAAINSGADVTIVCSTDATYPELAPAVTQLIKEKKPKMKVFLAGAPSKELKEICDAAGMDDYISVRSNCYETLVKMQQERGMF